MRRMFPLAFASALFAAGLSGCGPYLSPEQSGADDLSASTQELPGDCFVSLVCADESTVSCNGTNSQCSVGSSSVTCNGVVHSCPPAPGNPCYFNGVLYQDGYVYGHGHTPPYVSCSSKVNGVCRNGPLDGISCVASGDCYATCVNGDWVNL